MNNFITRVAQRAVGKAAIVQPLLVSRYAPPLEVSVPAALPNPEPPVNPAQHTSDLNSLPEAGLPSSTAIQDVRSAEPLDDVNASGGPLPASSSQNYAQKQSLGESLPDEVIQSHASIEAPAQPSMDELEQPRAKGVIYTSQAETQIAPAHFSDAVVVADHSNRAVNTGTISAMADGSFDRGEFAPSEQPNSEAELSSLRAEPGSEGEVNSAGGEVFLKSPGTASQDEVSFLANDVPPATRKEQRPLTPPLELEAIDDERSIEEKATINGRSAQPGAAPMEDQTLFDQSLTRPIEQHLRSLGAVGDEHPSPERIVRVTIGRIEVRALMPPAPPVEPDAPPAPKLSLDEFLRQHNGRRR